MFPARLDDEKILKVVYTISYGTCTAMITEDEYVFPWCPVLSTATASKLNLVYSARVALPAADPHGL